MERGNINLAQGFVEGYLPARCANFEKNKNGSEGE